MPPRHRARRGLPRTRPAEAPSLSADTRTRKPERSGGSTTNRSASFDRIPQGCTSTRCASPRGTRAELRWERRPDDRRKENQFRSRQSVRDQQKDEQTNQKRATHGRADRESGNQLHPIRLIDLRRRKLPEYIKRKGAPVRTIDSS